jgi:hypothetical protein
VLATVWSSVPALDDDYDECEAVDGMIDKGN